MSFKSSIEAALALGDAAGADRDACRRAVDAFVLVASIAPTPEGLATLGAEGRGGLDLWLKLIGRGLELLRSLADQNRAAFAALDPIDARWTAREGERLKAAIQISMRQPLKRALPKPKNGVFNYAP
jgi:hypothetical protein